VNHNEWRLLYFISFLLLVAFFVLNMFVGVVVENFHKCREKQEQEEKARRAAVRARKIDRKRKRPSLTITFSQSQLNSCTMEHGAAVGLLTANGRSCAAT